ncbi:MAG: glutamine--tRNA ligase, partial [Clostridia bacterium]|nr:glutamine--tRNA ligase [Clostridia bacterium]
CTVDLDSASGTPGADRKVKGTLHWVSAADCVSCEVRLYDRLFNVENPAGDDTVNFLDNLNPDSLKIVDNCLIEGGIAGAKPGDTFQFMRQGYFCVDKTSAPDRLVFNRTVALNSSWK